MVRLDLDAQGLWSWLSSQGAALRADLVAAICARAQAQAFAEFANGRGDHSLAVRFTHRAFALLGLTPRSRRYQRRQMRVFGTTLPYVAPRRRSYLAVARALTKPGANVMNVVRSLAAFKPHARDLTLVPQVGWRVQVGGRARAVTTRFTVAGMRILNRGGAKAAVYRREFLGFDRGGAADGRRIAARSNELALTHLRAAVERLPTRRITP